MKMSTDRKIAIAGIVVAAAVALFTWYQSAHAQTKAASDERARGVFSRLSSLEARVGVLEQWVKDHQGGPQ